MVPPLQCLVNRTWRQTAAAMAPVSSLRICHHLDLSPPCEPALIAILSDSMSEGAHRKTCKRWDVPWQAHCLTFSCFHRRPFFSKERCVQWFLRALDLSRASFDLWAYVIMPEHVHMVILPRQGCTISRILYDLKKPVTTWAISWLREHSPDYLPQMEDLQPDGKISHRFWQRGGGYDRNLRNVRDIHEKMRYVHLNPVRRGLVERAEDWPWSSYAAWEKNVDFPVAIDRQTLPPLENL